MPELSQPRGFLTPLRRDHLSQIESQTAECGGLAESEIGKEPVSRVLILGGGFGGIYAALEFERALRRHGSVEVTLVTRDNYFLFTPMLHEVAASDLELSAIVNPLRKLLRRVKTFTGFIESINLESKCVAVAHGFDSHVHELPYDHLILALGSSTNFFGLPGLKDVALTIKTLNDAIKLRNRLITHLEEANSECAADGRQPLLTFVVAGAGFAGVETLGGINDFIREAVRFYPNLKPELVRTVLISSDEFILPELGHRLGTYAQRKLAARGVEIIAPARVTAVRDGMVELSDGQQIPATTLIWAAGNAPNPLIAALPIPKSAGRVEVNEYLEVQGFPGVWALGDCALVPDVKTGGFHPPTAQHALREGQCVARNVAAELLGGRKKPFRYATLGKLAAIGNRTGVANVLGLNFSGFLAWWLWRTIYLFKLPRFEKKVRVALDWTLDLVFAKDFACVRASAQLPTWRVAAPVGADPNYAASEEVM
jgi:NADH:ubiquinone reductase (H+-translocating)